MILRLRKIIALFLLVLSLQWLLPAEIWHSLSSHEDTIDGLIANANTSVSDHHIHCLSLELSLPPMWKQQATAHFFIAGEIAIFRNVTHIDPVKEYIFSFKGRGPPMLIA